MPLVEPDTGAVDRCSAAHDENLFPSPLDKLLVDTTLKNEVFELVAHFIPNQ